MRKVKYDSETLKLLVPQSQSISEVHKKLIDMGIQSSYDTLRVKLRVWSIDTSHFIGSSGGWNRGQKNNGRWGRRHSLDDILTNKVSYTGTVHLKRRLWDAGLKPQRCEECGQPPHHNGRSLVLQLDHIDGNGLNNKLENLRILCPNCHSQTETFSGKNVIRTVGVTG